MATKYKDNEKLCIKAAFYAHPERLQEMIDVGKFDKELLVDIKFRPDVPAFPIWRIPQCWKIAMGDVDDYRDEIQETVKDFIARNNAVMDIFATHFGVEYTPIDFQQYHECFYSEDPEWSDEEIFDEDPAVLMKKFGTRPIDIQLYCAVERFDFPRVKELLEQGANPYVEVYEDGSANSFNRIGDECSYLCTCQLSYAWDTKRDDALDHNEIEDLIGWAAHETMYQWMEKYTKVICPNVDEDIEIPTTTRQAFAILDTMISEEDKKAFVAQSKSDFTAEQHFGLGLFIRNNWIYGPGEDEEDPEDAALREKCFRMLAGMKEGDKFFEHPDEVSGRFLEKYYNHLKRIVKQ